MTTKKQKPDTKIGPRKKQLITDGDPEAKFTLPTANDFGDADFIFAPDLKEIGEALISSVNGRIHELEEAKIIYLWKRKGPEKPRRVLGRCQHPSGLLEFFCSADFVITLMANNCSFLGLTKWQIEAVVFHELMHAGWIDGGPEMMPHDCECFAADFERYGLWKGDLERIAEASTRALQLPFEAGKLTPEDLARDPQISQSLRNLQNLADRDGVTMSVKLNGGEEVVIAKPRNESSEASQ